MSRCGRSIAALADWKAHPEGCTEKHGFEDGYDGPCTDDPWDMVQLIDMIDPMFKDDEIDRLRALLAAHAPDALAEYDAWRATPPGISGPSPVPATWGADAWGAPPEVSPNTRSTRAD